MSSSLKDDLAALKIDQSARAGGRRRTGLVVGGIVLAAAAGVWLKGARVQAEPVENGGRGGGLLRQSAGWRAGRLRRPNPIVYLRIVPLERGAARLTLSKFVGKIAASIDGISVVSLRRILWGARMWHHRAIVDSRPGQLSSSAPES